MEIIGSKNFITFAKVLKPDTCMQIIDTFDNDPVRRAGQVNSDDYSKVLNIKLSTDADITDRGVWRQLFRVVNPILLQTLQQIAIGFPALKGLDLGCTGFVVQHYRQGEGKFDWHWDAGGKQSRNRVLAMVCYLNDVAEGGETAFLHQDTAVKPQAGHAVFFPTGWTHVHRSNVPVSDDKYIISSFLEINDT